MRVTFSADDKIEMFVFGDNATVETVEEVVVPAMGLGASGRKLKWFLNGQLLQTSNKSVTLKMLNISDGDLITLLEEDRRAHPSSASAGQRMSRNVRPRQNEPVFFESMNFNEVLHYNPNPLMAVKVFRQHPEITRELAFHNPSLGNGILQAADDEAAAEVLREFLVFQTVHMSMSQIEEENKDRQMQNRLQQNPSDAEALAYMEDKQNQALIDAQHHTMVTEYPETMFPVLMLYIETKINGVRVQAFVDCGAQTSVMTLACAKKCGIDKLIDKRAAGKVVGVGQSATLGKIYIVPIQIEQTFYPMSVTVMESLGDKNMEFLFGLDMLRRHRFCIDLARGELTFHGDNGKVCATPFLHEKDLPEHKGGTQGFDPNKPRIEQIEDEEEEVVKKIKESSLEAEDQRQKQEEVEKTKREVVEEPIQLPAKADAKVEDPIPAQASTSSSEFQAKVNYLCSMGYAKEAVERILNQVDGDVETAQTLLMFESSM